MNISSPDPHHLPIRPEWLSLRRETIIDPSMEIIDAHHHLWDRIGRTPATYLLPDLLEDTGSGHTIVATVFMHCRSMYRAVGPEALKPVGETEFVNGVAAMAASGIYGRTRACAGIVGHADLRLGAAVENVLQAHIAAGGGRFRGIRHVTAWDADKSLVYAKSSVPPQLMGDKTFREGFARLAPLGLSFDAWILHPQLEELGELADRFADTRIILNHVGGPARTGVYAHQLDDVFRHWSASIRKLAKRGNVVVKLGGLGMRINAFGFEQAPEPPSSEMLAAAWKPYIETCIEAFGHKRCMFQSNFPVDKGSTSYHVLWNAFKLLAHHASPEEKAFLFRDTAKAVYRLSD